MDLATHVTTATSLTSHCTRETDAVVLPRHQSRPCRRPEPAWAAAHRRQPRPLATNSRVPIPRARHHLTCRCDDAAPRRRRRAHRRAHTAATPSIYSAPRPPLAIRIRHSHPSRSSNCPTQPNPCIFLCHLRPAGARAMASRRVLAAAAAMAVALMTVSWAPAGVGGDFAADQAECSDKLVGLATCLTYVQDQATAPTPDCCAGLKQVLQTSRKCLCVLVKDRDNPSLGLKLNVTKALGLPAICNAPANISDCPRLLNLPPNSKDAQVFEDFAKQAAAQGSAPSSGGSGSAAKASASPQKNGAAAGPAKRWLGVGMVGDGGARAVVLALFATLAVPFLILLG